MLPDGSINPGEMTSFNHYALGAIGDWLHRVVAGLAPEEPAYARLRIQPQPLAEFDHAWAEHLTPYGTAHAGWTRQDGVVRIEAIVPPNTTAVVVLPDGREFEVGSGSHEWEMEDAAPPLAATRVGLESTLAEVIDDREAYRAIVEVLEAENPEAAQAFRTHTKWSTRRELGEALFMHAGPDTQRLIGERLAELSAQREEAMVDA
jgi:alpha-L-rhamnosidase